LRMIATVNSSYLASLSRNLIRRSRIGTMTAAEIDHALDERRGIGDRRGSRRKPRNSSCTFRHLRWP
jgi:hypothetical protein